MPFFHNSFAHKAGNYSYTQNEVNNLITNELAYYIARKLNVDFSKIKFEDFVVGCNIELEHGLSNPQTNVTNNDLELTAKIALAHLNEFPNYYNKEYGLPALEKILQEKMKNNYRQIPSWK